MTGRTDAWQADYGSLGEDDDRGIASRLWGAAFSVITARTQGWLLVRAVRLCEARRWSRFMLSSMNSPQERP